MAAQAQIERVIERAEAGGDPGGGLTNYYSTLGEWLEEQGDYQAAREAFRASARRPRL